MDRGTGFRLDKIFSERSTGAHAVTRECTQSSRLCMALVVIAKNRIMMRFHQGAPAFLYTGAGGSFY